METEESGQPNLRTETKYSLVKNNIVKAEKKEEDLIKVADVDIHASDHEDDGDDEQSEDENNQSNKSVKFNEENNFVGEVGNSEQAGKIELSDSVAPVSARAVSTPASQSSPRPDSEARSSPARPSSAGEAGQENQGKLGKFSSSRLFFNWQNYIRVYQFLFLYCSLMTT